MFNHVTVAGVLSVIVFVVTPLVPVLPPVWGHLLASILALYAFYFGGQAVKVGRAMGVKGI